MSARLSFRDGLARPSGALILRYRYTKSVATDEKIGKKDQQDDQGSEVEREELGREKGALSTLEKWIMMKGGRK